LIIEAQKQGLPVNIRLIIDRVREDALLSVARAYADWTQPQTMAYTHTFQDAVVELSQLNTVYGKNTGDIQIVVDALELALSPLSPERFVIVAGDRDFVPLIQRLRRYRKHVTGIGLRDSSSPQLQSICDQFWFYDDLLPRAQAVAASHTPVTAATAHTAITTSANGQTEPKPVTGATIAKASSLSALAPAPPASPASGVKDAEPIAAELRLAFDLLLRAVGALDRNNQMAVLSNVKPKMQQMDPTFDFTRFNYETFQHFVEDAAKSGYVVLGPEMLGQRTLRPGRRPSLPVPPELEFSGRFESDTDALKFYRDALANKRVPLVQWRQRKGLLEALWSTLEDLRQDNAPGLTLQEMTDVLADAAGRNFYNLPRYALEKLAYTAIIGRCVHLLNPQEFDKREWRYYADCPLEEALRRVNTTYVRGIRMDYPDVVLMRRPLALLLFDSDNGDALVDIEEILERVVR
jgi:hypothetical protein